jgi:Protein of unknown function (DUF3455)
MRLHSLLAAFLVAAPALLAQSLPTSIDVPAGARLLWSARAKGAQIYACTDDHWKLKAPQAELFNAGGKRIGKHFAGPTWQLTDGSQVRGKAIGSRPAPQKGSAAWLLVEAVPGSATRKLAKVAYIRRTRTHGGAAPAEACSGDQTKYVPYTATYSFYAAK